MTPRAVASAAIAVSIALASSCGDVNAALETVAKAKSRSTDLLIQFTKATDAANRAVMSESDAAAVDNAKVADAAKLAVQNDIDSLRPLLQQLKYSEEARLLDTFSGAFEAYRELDGRILDLAVKNTNVKARALSLGAVQQTAEEFRRDVESVAPAHAERDGWQVKAHVATAVSAVREIQVLQATHIPNPDDSAMGEMEIQMKAAEASGRRALAALAALADGASRPRIGLATAALDRLIAVNSEIVSLSRQNSNVRSLALSLDQKQKVTAPCENAAKALHDALAKRGYPAGR